MEIYADLATVFRWQPSELERLSWSDLARYHTLAKDRLTTVLSLKL